jgi:hypothetical protein
MLGCAAALVNNPNRSCETPVTSEAMNAIRGCSIVSGTRRYGSNVDRRLNPVRYQVLAAEAGRWTPTHVLVLNYKGIYRYLSSTALNFGLGRCADK